MHGEKQLIKLNIPSDLLQDSLDLLKASMNSEKVLLWFGRKSERGYEVKEIFDPLQKTGEDFFVISPEGMDEILRRIKVSKLMMVAQIHTHPFNAFHSIADDKWAIVRHLNAYSLVVPEFCSTTTMSNFHDQVATYILDGQNRWVQIDNSNVVLL